MNDRYLYRAKRIDNVEWVEGLLTIMWGQFHIINPNDENTAYPIDPYTICQCTGLKDKNGKLIWENDILNRGNLVVTWKEELASYCLTKKGWMYQHFFGEAVDACDCEVVGNIFDNPELLETGKEAGKHGNQDILMPAT